MDALNIIVALLIANFIVLAIIVAHQQRQMDALRRYIVSVEYDLRIAIRIAYKKLRKD